MKQILLGLLLAAPLSAAAQALTPDVMQRITTANALTRQDVALRNALAANGIDAIFPFLISIISVEPPLISRITVSSFFSSGASFKHSFTAM